MNDRADAPGGNSARKRRRGVRGADRRVARGGPGRTRPQLVWPCAVVLAAIGCDGSRHPPPSAPIEGRAATRPAAPGEARGRTGGHALPELARWREHLIAELLPFWTVPDALGSPPGNFPTFRCNDGAVYRAEAPCPELKNPPGWIAKELGTEYTRMKSRQTFVYGVAFHVTGDPRHLAHAWAGVEWLRHNAFDAGAGGAITYFRDGVAGPPPSQRTTQDLAYAALGPAFYYYLTRDPAVLADLRRLEAHIFAAYWEPAWGMLRWMREDGEAGSAGQQDLVAQLDQINAYLLLLAPLLDGADAAVWRADLGRLAHVIKDRFFAPEHGLFWGAIHDPALTKLGSRHTDFGHSSKALWMIYLTGQFLGDDGLVGFARRHLEPLLTRAAQPSGCWASGVSERGAIDANSQWWVSAELDQAAATLSLREPDRRRYLGHLAGGYRCWLERFVDREHHEVWPFVPADWTPESFRERQPLKLFHWKSGYHSAEHALIALITTAGLTGEPITLHYAFHHPMGTDTIRPYLFDATIANREERALTGFPGLIGTSVTFRDVR